MSVPLQVERTGPDNQGGFNWTVTFTSDNQDGDLALVTVETDALTGSETSIDIYSVEDGSYIDGYINVTFDGNSTMLAANATEEDVRLGLESISTGTLAVTREGTMEIFEQEQAVLKSNLAQELNRF